MRLAVATFNIRHGLGTDGMVDLDRTCEAIASIDADVIALQEVDRGMARSGGIDQPAEIARATGYEVAFAPALGSGEGQYGIALAWRIAPAGEPVHVELPRVGEDEPRVALSATVGGVGFVTTHLSTRAGSRDLQLHALGRLAASMEPPAVVLGDLNCSRRSLGPLLRAGFVAGPRRATISWFRQVDHILVSRGGRVAVRTVRSDASDHRALVASVEVPPRRP